MAYRDLIQTDITITMNIGDDEFFNSLEEARDRLEEMKENKEDWRQFFVKEWVEDENGDPEEGWVECIEDGNI